MKVLHLHNQSRFQGGVERILYDIAASLTLDYEHGLLFIDGGSDEEFFAPFNWHGMSLSEAISQFNPDIAIIHKVSDGDLIRRVSTLLPTLVFVHDHDLTCPRRHKYTQGSDRACKSKAGVACLGNLCFVEKAHTDNLIPVRLFHGIRRQRDLLNASRGTSGFIVGSTSMRDELVLNGLSARHINIIPPVPKSLDSVEVIPIGDQPTILYVGQLVRGKGVDLLLRAFQKIHTRASLKIIGEGNHRVECEALALSLGIDKRVEFCGWVDHAELDNYYLQAQVVAVPSRWPEPFGMVGIESMARGRPVIAFDNGGISDWLTDGETGFLVTPGDIDQFAIKLETILVNDALRSAMGKVSSHRVQQQFTHQHFISQMNQLLQETYNEHHDIRVRSR